MDVGERQSAPARPWMTSAALPVAVLAALLALAAIGMAVTVPTQNSLAATIIGCLTAGGVAAPIGALVVRRRGNRVGWALLGIGLTLAFAEATLEYGFVAVRYRLDLPLWQQLFQIGLASYTCAAGGFALLALLFPTGSPPPGRHWRVLAAMGLAGLGATVVLQTLNPGQVRVTEYAAVDFENPFGAPRLDGAIALLQPGFGVLALIGVAGCLASLVVRFRRSSGDDRERIKWLAYVAVSAVVFLFAGEIGSSAIGCSDETCGNTVFSIFFGYLTMGVPIAVAFAILRRGLYDIEIVIRRTLVAALLAAFFLLVYAVLVGGVGAAVHSASSTALSFVAAVVVALLSQPVLARARRFADRLVYGQRATPYEVLAQFSGVVGETHATENVLDEMARVVAEGAGALQAEVWLRLGPGLNRAASWPARDPLLPDEFPRLDWAEIPRDVVVPVTHDDDMLGALSLSMPAAEPATPATHTLVTDLAGQAGLVLRNVQLIEELRASRRRLVTAQDEERRRLERNLHDGAQQQLIALRLRLRMAQLTIDADPSTAAGTLEDLGDAAQAALDDLRDLARGIYPPLLAERGLAAALEGQASRSVVDVTIEASEIGRYAPESEAAVYFCSLEALQNIAKYANASSAIVRIFSSDDHLTFEVTDDGVGFEPEQRGYGTGLQGMADRLAALGGTLVVTSQPGAGTTVTGRLPARPVATKPVPNAVTGRPASDRSGAGRA